jgi:hypothetical protein
MSQGPVHRLGALTGLALAAVVAIWWLGGTHRALDDGSDATRLAAVALQLLWLARALVLAVGGAVSGALQGWRTAAVAGLLVAAPAWPLGVLAWSASDVSPWSLLAAEAGLLLLAVLLPGLGVLLRRALPGPEASELLATTLGVLLALGLWWAHGQRWLPLS